MCLFKTPKVPTPPPTPAPPSPELIDPESQRAASDQRRRLRAAYGRNSTILAPAAQPTAAAKTLLGS